MASKDSARGKAFELAIGRRFGGRRRRNGEGIGFDDCITADGDPLPISIECKSYATLQLRKDWVEQARRNAGDRPWAIVQRPKGSRTTYATVDLEFLLEMYGRWIEVERLFTVLDEPINHQTDREVEHDTGGSL